MKKVIVLSLLITSFMVNAQNTLYSNYNNSMTGQSLNLGYAHQFGNAQIGGGLRYSFSNKSVNENIYYKNLDPNGIAQSFGAQVFFQYYILRELKHIEPFLLFDSQYAYSETSTFSYDASKPVRFGPFHWSENILGVGCRVAVLEKLYIVPKVGFGGMFIIGQDESLFKDEITWEFGGSFQIGFAWQL